MTYRKLMITESKSENHLVQAKVHEMSAVGICGGKDLLYK